MSYTYPQEQYTESICRDYPLITKNLRVKKDNESKRIEKITDKRELDIEKMEAQQLWNSARQAIDNNSFNQYYTIEMAVTGIYIGYHRFQAALRRIRALRRPPVTRSDLLVSIIISI